MTHTKEARSDAPRLGRCAPSARSGDQLVDVMFHFVCDHAFGVQCIKSLADIANDML